MRTIIKVGYLFVILVIFSCRTTPDNEGFEGENISLGTPVSVKVSFSGVEMVSNVLGNAQMSENQLVGGGG